MKAIIESSNFNRLIDGVKKSAAKTDAKPIQMWIRLELEGKTATAIAVDGYQMSVERAELLESVDEAFTVYVKPSTKRFPVGRRSAADKYVEIQLVDKKLFLWCEGDGIAYKQPEGDFLDWKEILDNAKTAEPAYTISFNHEYMLNALQSLKAVCPDVMRRPVIMDIRDPLKPFILRTQAGSERVVLPVRLKS